MFGGLLVTGVLIICSSDQAWSKIECKRREDSYRVNPPIYLSMHISKNGTLKGDVSVRKKPVRKI